MRQQPLSPRYDNTQWSAHTIAELYRARWIIEVFFKEIKQTLQLRDFVGTNEKAVKWQVWTGLLMHLLLRFLRHVSRWGHSFSRCVGIVRTALWVKTDLIDLLHCYGTAGGPPRPFRKRAVLARIRGLLQFPCGTARMIHPAPKGHLRNPSSKFQHTTLDKTRSGTHNPLCLLADGPRLRRPWRAYGMPVKMIRGKRTIPPA